MLYSFVCVLWENFSARGINSISSRDRIVALKMLCGPEKHVLYNCGTDNSLKGCLGKGGIVNELEMSTSSWGGLQRNGGEWLGRDDVVGRESGFRYHVLVPRLSGPHRCGFPVGHLRLWYYRWELWRITYWYLCFKKDVWQRSGRCVEDVDPQLGICVFGILEVGGGRRGTGMCGLYCT